MSNIRKPNPLRPASTAPAIATSPQPAPARQVVSPKGPAHPQGADAAMSGSTVAGPAAAREWAALPKRRHWLPLMLLSVFFKFCLCAVLAASSALSFLAWKKATDLGDQVKSLSQLPSQLKQDREELKGLPKNIRKDFSDVLQERQGELATLASVTGLSTELKELLGSNSDLIRLREKLDRLQIPSDNLRIEPSAVMIVALHSKELPQDKYVKLYQEVFSDLPRIGDHQVGLTVFTTSKPTAIVALEAGPAEGNWKTRLPPSDTASENLTEDVGQQLAGLFADNANTKRIIIVASAHCRHPSGAQWSDYAVDALLIARETAELTGWADFCGRHSGTLAVVPQADGVRFSMALRRLAAPIINSQRPKPGAKP